MIELSMPNGSIRLFGLAPESIVDGPGLRYAIFTQGCIHNCKGCHNIASHDPLGGYSKSIQSIYDDIIQNPLLSGVTFSGGEPFLQAQSLCILGKMLKKHNLPIITYTGYTLEKLEVLAQNNSNISQLLNLSHMLIDGPFIQELFDENLLFCGSSNQRIWYKDQEKWELTESHNIRKL